MKENMFDVLMYLFDHCIDEEYEQHVDQESIQHRLRDAGFRQTEINKAFDWLEGLTVQRETNKQPIEGTVSAAIRIYSREEQAKIPSECRGFLLSLERLSLVDTATREHVIDRALALESDEIDMEQFKWVVMMVLSNSGVQDNLRAWATDLVFEEETLFKH